MSFDVLSLFALSRSSINFHSTLGDAERRRRRIACWTVFVLFQRRFINRRRHFGFLRSHLFDTVPSTKRNDADRSWAKLKAPSIGVKGRKEVDLLTDCGLKEDGGTGRDGFVRRSYQMLFH